MIVIPAEAGITITTVTETAARSAGMDSRLLEMTMVGEDGIGERIRVMDWRNPRRVPTH